MKRIFAFCLIFLITLHPFFVIAATGVPGILPPSNVVGPYSTWFPSGQTGYVTNIPESSYVTGADLRAAKLAKIPIQAGANGVVDVAVTAEATIAADAVSARAAAMSLPAAGTAVAAALTAAQVATALRDAGFRYGNCANPGVIVGPSSAYCKPDAPPDAIFWYDTKNQRFTSIDAACQSQAVISTVSPNDYPISSDGTRCFAGPTGNRYVFSYPRSERNPNPSPGGYSPATGDDVAGALKLKMISDANARKALFDAMRADSSGTHQPDNLPPLYPENSPVTVTAPPAISPTVTTGTQSITRPDGSIDTVKTTQQTTVTPTTTGTTVGDAKTTFPSTTTTTTTTTNNVTNQTTTNTTVTNNPPALPEFPNDYNKEVTQQKIEKALNTDAAQPMPDQQKVITDSITQGEADRQKIYDGIQAAQQDKSAWFSWVWSPPVGVCSPITGRVAGYNVSWDLCPYILIIQSIIGWLLAVYSGVEIYGQLFKREG